MASLSGHHNHELNQTPPTNEQQQGYVLLHPENASFRKIGEVGGVGDLEGEGEPQVMDIPEESETKHKCGLPVLGRVTGSQWEAAHEMR